MASSRRQDLTSRIRQSSSGGLARILVIGALLVACPTLGAWLAGEDMARYLTLPPRSVATVQPGYSPVVFWLGAILLLLLLAPVVLRVVRCVSSAERQSPAGRGFPWWGWLGVALTAVAWILAWNRFSWFAPLQSHTFAPLWLGYILVVNGLCERRTGVSLLSSHPGWFMVLFPASALFWWLFEFLNRFVGNWHYVNVEQYTALEYTVLATVSFATVLPAVLSTTRLLASYEGLSAAFQGLPRLRWANGRRVALVALATGCLALIAVGALPRYAFALLWVAPLLIVLPVLTLGGEDTGLTGAADGDWRNVGLPATAALACGFFWEMWNSASQARWEYAIPYVDHWRLFEMPLLGYAGYLPFGVVCFVTGLLVAPLVAPWMEVPRPTPGLA